MLRLSLLFLFISFFCLYAFKNWYRSLCALILLMGIVEHPDMPKNLLGIQGVNPWNLLLLFVLAGFFLQRRREGLRWDMPRFVTLLLIVYVAMMLIAFWRMVTDPGDLLVVGETVPSMVSEYLVNTLKWPIPGLLLFMGCRSRGRFTLGLAVTLGVYLLLALQVIKWMPPSTILSGDDLSARSLKILLNEVGYHRVNLSTMLAGACWAMLAAHVLPSRQRRRWLVLGLAGIVLYAQALTGGRAGYGTWLAVGIVISLFRWRRYLLIMPVVLGLVVAIVPAARERMMQGFFSTELSPKASMGRSTMAGDGIDDYEVTAGRTLIWPYVVAKIPESPIYGHGRHAMYRTGLVRLLWERYRESFPHPHNAYLEWILDNGWLGLALLMAFYGAVLWRALSLFRDSRSPVFVAAGGAAVALVLSLMFGAIGSQTFYPREGAVGMWCAIGLMLRVSIERAAALRLARAREAEASASQAPVAIASYPRRRRKGLAAGAVDAQLWARAS